MTDNTEAAMGASSKDDTSNVVKKKKTKRTPSSGNRNAGMSSSARLSSSRSRDGNNEDTGDDHQQSRRRRRSKSTDRKMRRDSESQRRDNEKISSVAMNHASGDLSAGAAAATTKRKSSSPRRARKSKSDGVEGARTDDNRSDNHKSRKSRSGGVEGKTKSDSNHSDITYVRMSGSLSRGFDFNSSKRENDLQGSRSKSPEAPRLPQRSVSESSTLQSALEATDNKTASKTGDSDKNSNKSKDVEEASLGDFKKYAQEQQQLKTRSRFGASKTLMESRSSRMGDIPEESLGSFTAFAKKYEQEELMGLHDQPETVHHQQQNADNSAPIAPYNEEQSVSLGGLLSPMKQYGGGMQKAHPKTAEASLGSFTAFHQNYEKEKLLGLHDSDASGLLPPTQGQTEGSVPEEDSAAQHNNSKQRGKRRSSGEGKHEEFETPSSRIEKVGKRSGIGYRIMVDTPGGHSNEPMKIVVAIGFDDETDSEDEDECNEPQQERHEKRDTTHSRDTTDQHSEIDDSSHLPLSPLEEEKIKINRELRTRRLQQAMREPSTRKMKNWHADPDDEGGSEDEDEVTPLSQTASRWKEQSKRFDPGALKAPKREKSRSNHSTVASLAPSVSSSVSSVTLESALDSVRDRRIIIQTDACPSNPSFQRKPPGYRSKNAAASGLKRPSGIIKPGGTASLLKLAPHNLGTRRGLMLRQQSQASMKSSKSGVSTDSSWVDPNKDIPEDYEASFMQLNLLDMEKTEMQTNEEVQLAELPENILSSVDMELENKIIQASNINRTELSAIPEGKDPQKASSELLGMKTMLKHIKRVAPKRTKSFEFDKDTPKEMWNSLFARSKKGELAGSEYVDNGDDSLEIENKETQARNQGIVEVDNKPEVQTASSVFAAGLFSAIIGKGAGEPSPSNPSERNNSASKGKASMYTGTTKQSAPAKNSTPDQAQEHRQNGPSSEKVKDDDEGSIGIEDFGEAKDEGLENSQGFDNSGFSATGRAQSNRRRSGDKGKETSQRGTRSGRMADHSKKGGTSRSRAARAQHVHNRSLVDTLDYLTAEQDGGELLGPKNDMDESKKRTTRVRARRKVPNRTRSDDTTGRAPLTRVRSSDGTRVGLGRTKSQETGSPVRPGRDDTKRMNQSFSAVDPGVLPSRPKSTKRRESQSIQPADGPTNEFRDVVKKMQQSFSGAIEPSDLPSRASIRATKPRKGPPGNGKELPSRVRSHDKTQKGPGRKPRQHRKKPSSGVTEEKETSGHVRGIDLPKDATEEQLRQMLEYD